MTEKYHSLLSQNDLKLENYQGALNYAIDSDEIRNIALSGSYGSGKSSVIIAMNKCAKIRNSCTLLLQIFKSGISLSSQARSVQQIRQNLLLETPMT